MALAIAHLGEKLRKISKEANKSVAALSAYLHEVHFILFSKSPVQHFMNAQTRNLLVQFVWVSYY